MYKVYYTYVVVSGNSYMPITSNTQNGTENGYGIDYLQLLIKYWIRIILIFLVVTVAFLIHRVTITHPRAVGAAVSDKGRRYVAEYPKDTKLMRPIPKRLLCMCI